MSIDQRFHPTSCFVYRPWLSIVLLIGWLLYGVAIAQTTAPSPSQSPSPEFPPVPKFVPTVPPSADPPNMKNFLKVVPLSVVTEASPDAIPKSSTQPANVTPLDQGKINSGSTSIAQVLGSTTVGTVTKAYTITHLRATDVQVLLADLAAPLLSRETSSVLADARSNTLLVKGTEAEHQLVENLIRRVDVPVKQILVEVKIISADDYFGKSLGARFGITSSHLLTGANPASSGTQVGGTVADLNSIATTGASTFPSMISLPATNTLSSAPVSTFALGFYKLPAGINIGLEISALEEAGHTKTLSSPKLVLSNFKPGILSSGQRIPYSRPSIVQGVNTTEFIDAKVSITVTAMVAPNGTISMDLALTDDSVGSTSTIGPTINTNQVTSNVTLQSGETLVLGGFKSSAQTEDNDKTPLLGDIPILGNLFKSKSNTSVNRELMFIITPTVIESGG